MSNWSPEAQQQLDDYLKELSLRAVARGLDADEIVGEIAAHVRREVETNGPEEVTPERLREVLERVGRPEEILLEQPSARPQRVKLPAHPAVKQTGLEALFIPAIMLPVFAIVVELGTGIMRGYYADPMPTVIHLALLCMVPATYSWVWWNLCIQNRPNVGPLAWFFLGASLAVSLVYSVLYMPTLPISTLAILALGAGLLGFTPIACALSGYVLLRRLRRAPGVTPDLTKRFWQGGASVLVVYGVLLVPLAVTLLSVKQLTAAPENSEIRVKAERRIWAVGGEQHLQQWANIHRPFMRAMNADGSMPARQGYARHYYRLTGQSVFEPAPFRLVSMLSWPMTQRAFIFRTRTRDLRESEISLGSSRMDIFIQGDTSAKPGVAYMEWVMELTSSDDWQEEAEALLLLPPGGVCSRLTLWINGEEQEAAFGGRNQTTQAYQDVAIVQRRDPALLTTEGADKVRLRVFPVSASLPGKVKVGITFPLALRDGEAQIILPRLEWTDFDVPNHVKHQVWVESGFPLESTKEGWPPADQKDGVYSVHGESPAAPGTSADGVVASIAFPLAGPQTFGAVVANQAAQMELTPASTATRPKEVLLVVDDSAQMRDAQIDWKPVVDAFPKDVRVSVLIAGDNLEGMIAANETARGELVRWLENYPFRGGVDPVPALKALWKTGGELPLPPEVPQSFDETAVIWVHGPLPFAVSPHTAVVQAAERQPHIALLKTTGIWGVQAAPGPNALASEIADLGAYQRVADEGTPQKTLEALARRLRPEEVTRQFKLIEALPQGTPDRDPHVARLAIAAHAQEMLRAGPQVRATAQELAASARVVTPLTGAVVLERKEQYEAHGLDPGKNLGSVPVPAIPEPEEWAMLGLVVALLIGVVWRQRRQRVVRAGV